MNAHRVEYLLVGGYAVASHGYPRATGDLDIWIAIRPDNARRLTRVLDEFGFGQSAAPLDLLTQPGRVIRMGLPPLRIELQTSISGVDFDDCYRRRITTEMDGVQVEVISADDLKRNKRAAGRNKDLGDLENLP